MKSRAKEKAIYRAGRALAGESSSLREIGEAFLIQHAATHPCEVMDALGEVMMDDAVSWRFFMNKYESLIETLPLTVTTSWLERAGVEGARRIARSLPAPRLDENGCAVVPPLTEWVLNRFEADDRVFHEFLAGTISGGIMSGDIAAILREKARVARLFSKHSLRRIREWAAEASKQCEAEAEHWRQMDEELLIH